MSNVLTKIKSLQKGDRVKVTTSSLLQSGIPKTYFGEFQDYEPRHGDFVFTVNVDQGETNLIGASKPTPMNFRNSTVRNVEKY